MQNLCTKKEPPHRNNLYGVKLLLAVDKARLFQRGHAAVNSGINHIFFNVDIQLFKLICNLIDNPIGLFFACFGGRERTNSSPPCCLLPSTAMIRT